MGDWFLGEIRAFSYNWAPKGWALCQGQTMQIQQNQALYSLLGVQFGGDAVKTFCLPDLSGRTMANGGVSDDQTYYNFASKGGAETVTLSVPNVPGHAHQVTGSSIGGTVNTPAGSVFGTYATKPPYAPVTQQTAQFQPLTGQTVVPVGGMQHDNMQPSLTINYCIATTGIYPPRS